MLLVLEPDQEFLRDTTARFLAERADARTVRSLRDHPDGFERDYWRDGSQLGWTHLLVPDAAGGGSVSAHGLVDLTLLAHEFGKRAAPGPLLVNAVVAGALALAGGHEEVVKGILAGEQVATWAGPLDVGPGGRPSTVAARRDGDAVVLDGVAIAVESAEASTHVLVTAEVSSDDGTGELIQVLVPTETPGLTATAQRSVDLTRRFAAISFDAVRVATPMLLDWRGATVAAVRRQLLQSIVIAAAESVGAMDVAFATTLDWCGDRYSFGRPLSSYQAIKHRMAQMKTWLEAGHAIADEAALAVATDAPDAAKLASAAAAYIGATGAELMQECVQLHGGIGVTYEHDLHLFLRRHTLNRMLHGTPADHRRRVARELRAELERHPGVRP